MNTQNWPWYLRPRALGFVAVYGTSAALALLAIYAVMALAVEVMS